MTVPSDKSSSFVPSDTLRVPCGNVGEDVFWLASMVDCTFDAASLASEAAFSKFSLLATFFAVSVTTLATSSVLMELTLLMNP